MTSRTPRDELRKTLFGAALLLPGVANALAARVVADQGFAAAYVTGAGIANTFFGIPIGLVTLSESAMWLRSAMIRAPLVVDADTGFGNAAHHTEQRQLPRRAGADALQIQDGVLPSAAAISRARR